MRAWWSERKAGSPRPASASSTPSANLAPRQPSPEIRKVKIRGLAYVAAGLLGSWGGAVALKSIYDLFISEPEANLYAPQKWAFVTKDQWLRYAGFELAYGLACLALAWLVLRYARFLPIIVERPRRAGELGLFG